MMTLINKSAPRRFLVYVRNRLVSAGGDVLYRDPLETRAGLPDTPNVMMPLLACDRILFAGLWAVWRDPQLLDDLGKAFLSKDPNTEARALFRYLFIDTECPAAGTDNRGVGFRLRDADERLRHANEVGLGALSGGGKKGSP